MSKIIFGAVITVVVSALSFLAGYLHGRYAVSFEYLCGCFFKPNGDTDFDKQVWIDWVTEFGSRCKDGRTAYKAVKKKSKEA